MKILHLTLDLPYPPIRGAQIRDHALISRMAKDHEVHLISFCERPPEQSDIDEVRAICHSVEIFPRPVLGGLSFFIHACHQVLLGHPLATVNYVYTELFDRIRRLLAEEHFDIFQIEHSFLAPYRAAAPDQSDLKTVLSLHNIGALQYPRMAALPGPLLRRLSDRIKALLMRNWEAKWCGHFDHVVTMSDDETAFLRSRGVTTAISVVANGVDTSIQPFALNTGCRVVLFVGNLTYLPNVDAVRFFAREVLPVLKHEEPETRFVVAGFKPPDDLLAGIDGTNIEVISSPAGMRAIYERAAVVVVPLRAGGGTRLKILEALTYGRPVVSTGVGAEGLGLCDGKDSLIADDPKEMALRVLALFHDPALSQRLVENGRKVVETTFDWSYAAERLLAVYEHGLAGSAASQPKR